MTKVTFLQNIIFVQRNKWEMSLIQQVLKNRTILHIFLDDDLNVVDNDWNYEINLFAPGISKTNCSFDIEDCVITIIGKNKKEIQRKTLKEKQGNFSINSFLKSFKLPKNLRVNE